MKKIAILCACLGVMVAGPALAVVTVLTNMLANGSFESGTGAPANWSNTGTTVVAGGSNGTTADNYGSSQSPDTAGANVDTFTANLNQISQVISLVKGTIYQIGYDVELYGSGSNTLNMSVMLGGTGLLGLSANSGSLTAGSWIGKMTTFQATTTNATATFSLTMTDTGTGQNLAVDRVYVSNIPEPSSMVLLLGGTIGLLRLRRRGR